MTPDQIHALIAAERDRQGRLWNRSHEWGWGDCSAKATLLPEPVKLAVLNEEVGEVAKALLECDRDGLRTELVQVAAVSQAWLEAL